MKKIGVAIIGCGYWGPNLIRNFQRLDNAELRWICDKEVTRLEQVVKDLHLAVSLTTNYNDLLQDPEVDAVVVATPVSTHYTLTRDALKARKHALIEKPLARTLEEANLLIALAQEHDCVLMVDHTFLFSSPVRELKHILGTGDLGKILYVHSMRVNLGLFQEDINVLWDLLPHDLSIIDYLLDAQPVEVSAQGMAHIDSRFEDVAFLTVYYHSGLIAHFHVSWLDPCKIRRMTFVGDHKMAVYDDMDSNEPIRIFDKRISRHPYFTDFGEFKLHYRFGDIYSPRIQIIEPLKQVCSHFLECIRKKSPPLSGGDSGRRVVKVLTAAERSLKNRGKIEPIQPD